MTLSHYFIFLACLSVFNIAVLYSYFLHYEFKEFDKIHNEFFTPTLKHAYSIFILSFSLGVAALFYFTPDQTWFFESNFLYFCGLLFVFLLFGFIPTNQKNTRLIKGLLEFGSITGFVFFLPDNDLFSKTVVPVEAIRVLAAIVWFIIFKFTLVLNQFEGVIPAQTFHIGFSSLLILVIFSTTALSLFQINASLSVLIFMLSPFYYVLQYQLPLTGSCLNFICLLITGVSFFTVLAGYWGIGVLMLMYVLFEMTVFVYRRIKNFVLRKKEPLFFFETLSDRGVPEERAIGLIIRYHLLISALMLFIAYSLIQVQAVILSALLYLKLYFRISDPSGSQASLKDLYHRAKKDARRSITNTNHIFSVFKEKYSVKNTPRKENDTDADA